MFAVKLQTALLATSLFLFVPPVVLTPQTVLAQSNARTQRVQFKPGANGSGMVTVKKLDGRTRDIFFDSGKATGYDQNQADPGGTFSAIKQSDLNIISIGQERYEIPDAVIFGG